MLVQEIASGVFVAADPAGANLGLIKTSVGAVLIDAPWAPEQVRAWRAEVERLSPTGVAYLITTDYHWSHALGTCFLPSALTIAHEAAWKYLRSSEWMASFERMLEQRQISDSKAQIEGGQFVLPQLTVGKSMTLWCGDRRIDILHLGGHTAATLGVYLPDVRVLFSGDVVVNGRPPYVGDANSREWLESLEHIRTMDIQTIVPGHGRPGGLELADQIYRYLKDLRTRVEACYQAGYTRRETVERVKSLDGYSVAPGDEERIRRLLRSGVERIYDEIKKENTRNRSRDQA